MKVDVDQYESDLLIAFGKEQRLRPEKIIDCMEVVKKYSLLEDRDLLEAAVTKFQKNGWGVLDWDGDNLGFGLNSTGIAEADRAEHIRQPLSLGKRLKRIPRSDWIAIVALIFSIISAAAAAFSTYISYLALEAK